MFAIDDLYSSCLSSINFMLSKDWLEKKDICYRLLLDFTRFLKSLYSNLDVLFLMRFTVISAPDAFYTQQQYILIVFAVIKYLIEKYLRLLEMKRKRSSKFRLSVLFIIILPCFSSKSLVFQLREVGFPFLFS